MASKVAFLGRILDAYGPEAAGVREQFRDTVEAGIGQMWPRQMGRPANFAPDKQAGDALYGAIHHLSPQNDTQAALKSQAASLAYRPWSGAFTVGSAVGSLGIEDDADYSRFMARGHFPRL